MTRVVLYVLLQRLRANILYDSYLTSCTEHEYTIVYKLQSTMDDTTVITNVENV